MNIDQMNNSQEDLIPILRPLGLRDWEWIPCSMKTDQMNNSHQDSIRIFRSLGISD